ncbi:MAG TPA: ABC transporter substrate-binding protein [Nocardioidaceae bacterium]|nr:ABC transporter substrate-binding protein [Nocardioidaceae bacterium]
MRRNNLLLGIPAAAVALMLVAACGSATGGGDGTPVGDNVATGTPLKIGAMTPSNGPEGFPENEYGALAAEWYVNNEMGGINGHKLELDICKGDGSPETAVACANGFVSSGYPAVVDAYDFSFGGARPILVEAGIPFGGTVSGDPTNETVEYGQGFYFTGPLAVTAAGVVNMWKAQGTETANFVVADAPSAHAYVDSTLAPWAEATGVEMQVQYVASTQANYNAIAAALMDGDPDMTGSLSLPEDGCTSLFTALRQQGYDGDIYVGSCTEYVEEMSAQDAAGTLTIPRLWLPQAKEHAPAGIADQMDAFTEAMEAVGHGDNIESRAIYAFASVVTMAEALSTIEGDVTPETATQALKGLKRHQMFLGPDITCDGNQWPGLATACAASSIFFTVQEDGSYMPGDPNGFVDIDKSLLGG